MIKTLSVFAGIFLTLITFAQEKNDEFQTIFGDDITEVSGFGGFDMQFSSIGGDYALGTGGSGGVLLNNQVVFGGYGMGINMDKPIEVNNVTYKNVSMGSGGLFFGYILKGKSAIHPALFLQTGWGGINLNDINQSLQDNIFVLNPSLEIELNITRFFRIAVGGHYQFTTGLNKYSELKNSDFSGPGGKLSFKFGWF